MSFIPNSEVFAEWDMPLPDAFCDMTRTEARAFLAWYSDCFDRTAARKITDGLGIEPVCKNRFKVVTSVYDALKLWAYKAQLPQESVEARRRELPDWLSHLDIANDLSPETLGQVVGLSLAVAWAFRCIDPESAWVVIPAKSRIDFQEPGLKLVNGRTVAPISWTRVLAHEALDTEPPLYTPAESLAFWEEQLAAYREWRAPDES